MDSIASKELAQRWPNIKKLEIDISSLHSQFNYGGKVPNTSEYSPSPKTRTSKNLLN